MSLQLLYQFSPASMRASQAGHAVVIDLEVKMNEPAEGWTDIELARIEIDIPIGSGEPGALTAATGFDEPAATSDPAWRVDVSSGPIVLTPASGGTAVVKSIEFTLTNVTVNEAVGTVPLTVTEYAQPGDEDGASDAALYRLEKWDPDVYAFNFRADPSFTWGPEQPTKLYWDVTELGKQRDYRLRGGNLIHKWTDGGAGIEVAPGSSVTYELEVIDPHKGAFRQKDPGLTAKVNVRTPSVELHTPLPLLGGRTAGLSWYCENVSSCRLTSSDGQSVPGLPGDTLRLPYFVMPPPAAGGVVWTLHAEGPGGFTSTQAFEPVPAAELAVPMQTVPFAGELMGVTFTPDGKFALGGWGGARTYATIGRTDGGGVVEVGLGGDITLSAIAATARGDALIAVGDVASYDFRNPNRLKHTAFLKRIALPSGAVTGSKELPAQMGWGVAALPTQDEAGPQLVIVPTDAGFLVVDVATLEVVLTMPGSGSITVFPNGGRAVVTTDTGLSLVDLPDMTKSVPVALGGQAGGVAVSPDGRYILATVAGDYPAPGGFLKSVEVGPLAVTTVMAIERLSGWSSPVWVQGSQVAALLEPSGLHLVDVPRAMSITTFPEFAGLQTGGYSAPDGRVLIARSDWSDQPRTDLLVFPPGT